MDAAQRMQKCVAVAVVVADADTDTVLPNQCDCCCCCSNLFVFHLSRRCHYSSCFCVVILLLLPMMMMMMMLLLIDNEYLYSTVSHFNVVHCIGPKLTPFSVKLNASTFIIKNCNFWFSSYFSSSSIRFLFFFLVFIILLVGFTLRLDSIKRYDGA